MVVVVLHDVAVVDLYGTESTEDQEASEGNGRRG